MIRQEWFEVNQLGVYASSNLVCAHTRRHHGLLVIPFHSLKWNVFLNQLDETVLIEDQAYPLATQFYQGTVCPEGYRNMERFALTPFPTWVFRIEDIVLAKSLILLYEEPTVLVRYQILNGDENWVRLEIRPLISIRKGNHLTDRKSALYGAPVMLESGSIYFSGLAPNSLTSSIFFYHNAAVLDRSGKWYRSVYYSEEQKQGLEFEEDLYSPFRLQYSFLRDREAYLCVSARHRGETNFASLILEEESRRAKQIDPSMNIPSSLGLDSDYWHRIKDTVRKAS